MGIRQRAKANGFRRPSQWDLKLNKGPEPTKEPPWQSENYSSGVSCGLKNCLKNQVPSVTTTTLQKEKKKKKRKSHPESRNKWVSHKTRVFGEAELTREMCVLWSRELKSHSDSSSCRAAL